MKRAYTQEQINKRFGKLVLEQLGYGKHGKSVWIMAIITTYFCVDSFPLITPYLYYIIFIKLNLDYLAILIGYLAVPAILFGIPWLIWSNYVNAFRDMKRISG